jgi:hypothetical protein
VTPFWCGHESARIEAREADQRFADQVDRVARWVAFTVFLCLAFAATCRAQSPSAVLYISRIEPTPALAALYHEVETCMHVKGHFKQVDWYAATASWNDPQRGTTWGLWTRHGTRTQIIAVAADTALLRHEILHDVLYHSGWRVHRTPADSGTNAPEHPSPPFADCARRFFPPDYKPWGRQ